MSSKSKSDTFKKGERVQARWAGSKQFYEGKIIDVLKTVCKVQFDNDGTVSSVKLADIKKPGEEISPKPTRSKTRSRSRSAGRTSRSRSRSPARKSSRPKKEKSKNEKKSLEKAIETSINTNSLPKDEIDSSKISSLVREELSSLRNIVSPVVKLNSFSSKETITVTKEESIAEGRSKRLSALRSMETTQRLLEQKRLSNAKAVEKAKYSDDEDEEEEEDKSTSAPKKLSRAWQSFYFTSTLLKIILLPAALLFLLFACTAKNCTILEVPTFYSRWMILINNMKIPLVLVATFHILLNVVPLIPFGNKITGFATIDSKTPLEYRLHGFIYLIVSSIIFAICVYFGINMNWGLDKFRPIAISSLVYCVSISLLLFVYHSFKGHGPIQSTVPFIGRFYSGSFTNPILFGKIDVKTSFIQAGLIGSVLLNFSILTKYILLKGIRTALPLGLTSGMQIFLVADILLREHHLLSTATYTSDSVGYAFILTYGFLVPFGLSAQNLYHYLYETKTSLTSYWYYSAVALIVVLFFIGYFLFLVSSKLKHNFRKDPYGKSMLKYDSVPTQIKSKRLLLSGGWGLVRHPNYLGLLIMALAWTLPCGYTHAVPYGPLLLLAVALIFRIFRIESECQQKYGPGWKNYTETVRSRLIPYIF